MPKSKPDKVVVHRIELQQTERDLLEMAILGNVITETTQSLAPILVGLTDPTKLYGFLTILEMLDLIDTPLPTLGDGNPLDKIKEWITGSANEAERRDLNQEVQQNLALQAAEASKKAESDRDIARKEYYANPNEATKKALDNAQEEANRIQGEAKKRADIARGWNWKFRYENGRNPKTYEIMAAKIRGEWYGPS
jgi:hypothetical protein